MLFSSVTKYTVYSGIGIDIRQANSAVRFVVDVGIFVVTENSVSLCVFA